MAKITEYPAAASVNSTDKLVVVQSGAVKTATVSQLPSGGGGGGPALMTTLEAHGAAGDGVTNDTAAFTAALAAVSAGTYDGITLGARTYLTTGGHAVPAGCSVIGQGVTSIVKTTTDAAVFTVDAAEEVVLKDFQILGNVAGSNQFGISCGAGGTGQARVRISGVYARLLYRGFSFLSNNGGADGPQVSDCVARGCSYGFYCASGSEWVTFTNCHAYQGSRGLYIASGNISWTGGTINYNTIGVELATGSNDSHGIVTGAHIDHNTSSVTVGAITNGFTFSACNLYQGTIDISGNTGMVDFFDCVLDPEQYNFTSAIARFIDCRIDDAYFISYNESGATDVEWTNCRKKDGTVPSYIGSRQRVAYTFGSDADSVLSAQQSRAQVIEIADGVITVARALSSTRSPSQGERIVVVNRNAQSVNYYWASGAGITIPTNNTAVVGADGTNAKCELIGSNVASTAGALGAVDPTTLALTGLYRGSYGGAPWAGTASAGTSGSHTLQNGGTAPAVGTSLNGFTAASFNGTTQTLADTVTTADSYISTTAYRVSMLIKPTSLSAPAANIFDNPGLVTEAGGNWGIVIDNTGVHVYHSSALVASSAAALTAGSWYAVDVIFDGANVTVTVNGTAGTAGASAGTGSVTGAALKVGANYSGFAKFAGEIEELDIANASLSGTSAASWKAYFNSRYALSL